MGSANILAANKRNTECNIHPSPNGVARLEYHPAQEAIEAIIAAGMSPNTFT